MHIHILGICGTLMGSIALLARELGHEVSGSDENVYPPMSTQLETAGIRLASPYTEANVPKDADLIVIGNAGLPRGNPAVEAVLNRRMPYTSGAEWIGRYVLQGRWVIAVAGTHGKTTTTSMIAWILEYSGMNPGFLIGGIPGNFQESARLGKDPFFVIEADEYDTSYFDRRSKFLHYRPMTAVLNNLEYDHADIFPDLAAIQNQFHLLVRSIPGKGLIVHPAADDNLREVLDRGCWTPTLGFANKPEENASITGELKQPDAGKFEVILEDQSVGTVQWSLSGRHNMHNALAAIGATRHAGIKPEQAVEALCQFKNVKRRMELIFESAGVMIYDDFAHHPSAIISTLDGLRKKVGKETILAIIEPGSHTMKKGTHKNTLPDSVNDADHVIWFEPDNLQWDLRSALRTTRQRVSGDIDEIISWAVALCQTAPIHIVIMSNSGFAGMHRRLISQLTGR